MSKKSRIIVYHGSDHVVDKPQYGLGRVTNDYGRGFYTTSEIELAKEWACPKKEDGITNKYELDISELKIMDLSSDKYSILHWITMLVQNRVFDITDPEILVRKKWLIKNYSINVNAYDIICGYRADDSYFSFARAFLDSTLSLNKLEFAMKIGNLGEQIVLKSKKAFDKIKFLDASNVDSNIYYFKRKNRDDEAKNKYLNLKAIKDIEPKKIDDLMKEKP